MVRLVCPTYNFGEGIVQKTGFLDRSSSLNRAPRLLRTRLLFARTTGTVESKGKLIGFRFIAGIEGAIANRT
jgi:hypothetical protein